MNRERLFGASVVSLLALGFSAGAAHASEIVVQVTGIDAPLGQIGCALHADPDVFPMGQPDEPVQWIEADASGVQCVFSGVEPGAYAVAIAHDVNDNQETDTNFVGMPKEEWGVSGNIRHSFRAPRFDEAEFAFAGERLELSIEID